MIRIINVFKNHKKKTIASIVVIFIILGSVQIFAQKGSGEISVITGKVIEDGFEQSVFATGTLEVQDKKDLFIKVSGQVEEILVEPGQRVNAGQALLNLEADELALQVAEEQAIFDAKKTELIRTEATLRKAQKEYELARKELERTKALYDAGAVSQAKLEEDQLNFITYEENLNIIRNANLPLAKAQLEEARVILEQAQTRLRDVTITSPIQGALLSLNAKVGHPLAAGTLVASIGNLEKLEIETGINEVDAAELEVGNLVEISSEGLLEDTFKGHIEYLAPIAQIERTSQGEQTQVKIRVAVDDVDNSKLKPGYNVNLKIILAQKEKAVLVPYEAVTERNGEEVVFVVAQDSKVAERRIEIGLSNALFFEVLSGLEKGDKVILNPNDGIKEGIKVKANDQNK